MEVLAVDFDGVLRKWPGFIGWYANFLKPGDLLIRSKLYFLRRLLTKIFMDYTPIIIDGELVESLKLYKPERLILVSGRYIPRQKGQVFRILSPYLNINKFYFREDSKELEWKFKERILKKEKATIFIEDREFVVRYLKMKGINAIHIKEVRK